MKWMLHAGVILNSVCLTLCGLLKIERQLELKHGSLKVTASFAYRLVPGFFSEAGREKYSLACSRIQSVIYGKAETVMTIFSLFTSLGRLHWNWKDMKE